MDPPDDDIEFDFFEDEPRTTEAQQPSRVRLPRRGGSGGGRRGMRRPAGPPRGLTPFVRLVAAVAILVAIFVIFGLLLESCAATSKHDEYANYMAKVAVIAKASSTDGNAVASALASNVKIGDLETKLNGIAQTEQQNEMSAARLNPPGPLRAENQNLVDALHLRAAGTQGLADALEQTAHSKSAGDSTILAAQGERLLASDVLWDDLFMAPANHEMGLRGVTGVQAPESHFVTNPDMATARSMGFVLDRLRGASTGGTPTGLHGTNLVSVRATPNGPTLSTANDLNQVIATPDLGIDAVVHDGGNSQEVQIKVTLTIQPTQGSGKTIVKTKTIAVIDPDQEQTVHFTNLQVGTLIAERVKLTVDVAPVLGEADKTNNSATYSVIFSLS